MTSIFFYVTTDRLKILTWFLSIAELERMEVLHEFWQRNAESLEQPSLAEQTVDNLQEIKRTSLKDCRI